MQRRLLSSLRKKPDDWLRNQHTQAYIQELLNYMNQSRSINSQNATNLNSCDNSLIPFICGNSRRLTKSISYDDLVVSKEGPPQNGGGTWLHPKLAVIFARWLSAHFAVWCDNKIAELLQQHPEYQKQFSEISVIFEKLEQYQHRTDQRFEQVADMFNNCNYLPPHSTTSDFGGKNNSSNQLNTLSPRFRTVNTAD